MRNYIYTPINKPYYILTKLHYVYKTTNLINGKYYIGKHTQLMGKIDKYYGSGTNIINAIKKYKKSSFKKEIICFCSDSCSTYELEKEIVTEKIINDPMSYNLVTGGYFKLKDGSVLIESGTRKFTDEARKRMSDSQKGKTISKDKFGNKHYVSINDPRYISGELVSITVGKVMLKDKFGKYHLVDQNDPRYLSGELVGVNTGKTMSYEQKQKISNSLVGDKNPFYGKQHNDDVLNMISNHYMIDGISYRGRSDIAKKYNISIRTVGNRCNSDNWESWILVKRRI